MKKLKQDLFQVRTEREHDFISWFQVWCCLFCLRSQKMCRALRLVEVLTWQCDTETMG